MKAPKTVPGHLLSTYEGAAPGLTDEASRNAVRSLLLRHAAVFFKDDNDLGLTHLTEHVIETGNARAVKQPPRRVPLAFAGEDQQAKQKLVDQGSVCPPRPLGHHPLS